MGEWPEGRTVLEVSELSDATGSDRGAVAGAISARAGLGRGGRGTAAAPVATAWVPADACTLPTAEQPFRVAEFAALLATALRRAQRRERGWLRLWLTATPEVEATTRELIARESQCCSFFDFHLTSARGDLLLDVRVPDDRCEVLDGISRQAEAVQARASSGS